MLLRRYEEYDSGEGGGDLTLTIDATIQYYVIKHLREAAREYDVQHGAGAIAMDPNTGAILAMASLADYDPNHFLDVDEKAAENIALAGSSEEAEALRAAAQALQWRNKGLSET